MANGKSGSGTGRRETYYLVHTTNRLRYLGELALAINGELLGRRERDNGKLMLVRSQADAFAKLRELNTVALPMQLRLLHREPTEQEKKANKLSD